MNKAARLVRLALALAGCLLVPGVWASVLSADVQSISGGKLEARFDPASGRLTLLENGKAFAVGELAGAGKTECSTERLGQDSPLGPGSVLKVGPGEGRVVIRQGSPFVFIRRDGRSGPVVQPGNRAQVLRAKLDLGVAAGKLKVLGPGGLLDPAGNKGQHVLSAVADPVSGAGVVAGLVRIDAVSGALFTAIEGGQVVLTLRDDYGSAVPPHLKTDGGDWWAVGRFDDARLGLEAWADEFARINQVKLPPVPVGHMTWYCERHGGALNQTAVIELAQYLSRTFGPWGYDFLQIDDLWQNGQKRNGPAKDFTKVNPKGPYKDGMTPVAQKIRALGLRAGLWLLPFAIDHQDPVLAQQAKLVAHRADGSPYETNWSGTALDLTLPAARDYVRGFIAQAVKDWGYTYLKLDGLHIALASPQTYPNRSYVEDKYGDAVLADKTMSNMQAARAGLRAVRDGAGPDTFILGCCAPQNERSLGMVMGLVDAMRVGADSGVRWGGVVEGVRSSAVLYFFNGRVWWNDPDSIYARSSMPLNEVRCFAAWVTLTGMLNNQSDWSPLYGADRVELLRRTMPSHQLRGVRPVDLFENDPPRVWVLDYAVARQPRKTVGLFNWSDREAKIVVPAARLGLDAKARYAAVEFWSGRAAAPFAGELSARVAPRSCQVLSVRDLGNRPAVLGTSRHITGGAVDLLDETWDPAAGTLAGASRVVGGDPYEVRVLTACGQDKITCRPALRGEVSQADRQAGVKADLATEGGLVRLRLSSPASREVRWSVAFGPPRDEPPPAGVTDLKAEQPEADSPVRLCWNGSGPFYAVRRDGRLLATVGSNQWSDAEPLANRPCRYEVAAVTFAGQAGPSARVDFTAVKPVLGPVPPKPDVTLSSLKPLEARTGWGKLTVAKSITGRPLQLGKTTYADGIGLHAPARAVYQRRAEWKRFVAVVGINESQRPADQSSLICRVAVATADGEKVLASSPTLRFGRMERWHFDVALPDRATRVILLVDQADNADKSDHADWCDAGFLK